MSQETLTLEGLANGALAEQFSEELLKVLKNIDDPNTDPKAKRSISIKVSFKPDEKRDMANIDVTCVSTLAPYKSIGTMAAIGKIDGDFVAQEFNRNAIRGQKTVEEYEKDTATNVQKINFKNAESV